MVKWCIVIELISKTRILLPDILMHEFHKMLDQLVTCTWISIYLWIELTYVKPSIPLQNTRCHQYMQELEIIDKDINRCDRNYE